MPRVATAVWTISPELVLALDAHLGTPVDSYVNGSQTWLVGDADAGEVVVEFRLHPVASYVTPKGASHYDVWDAVVDQLTEHCDPAALRIGEDLKPLTGLWDGLEAYSAYGEDLEPVQLTNLVTAALERAPDRTGLVDHEEIGDAWEKA